MPCQHRSTTTTMHLMTENVSQGYPGEGRVSLITSKTYQRVKTCDDCKYVISQEPQPPVITEEISYICPTCRGRGTLDQPVTP